MPPLVQVRGLQKSYRTARGGRVPAVRGVDLELHAGQCLGLLGESGCGKSTLGRCVLRLEEVTAGEVLFDGTSLTGLGQRDLAPFRRQMQMIFQDPDLSLDSRLTVGQNVAEPLVVNRLVKGREARRQRAKELLCQVGLDGDLLGRYPHELSGGQRQRICIARALATSPRFIVADEPVSSLDLAAEAQVLDLLESLQQTGGLSFLFISHDVKVVGHISQVLAVMYLGRVVEQGSTSRVLSGPLHPYTRALVDTAARLALFGEPPARTGSEAILEGEVPGLLGPPAGCPFHPRCAVYRSRKGRSCIEQEPALLDHGTDHRVACHEVEGQGT